MTEYFTKLMLLYLMIYKQTTQGSASLVWETHETELVARRGEQAGASLHLCYPRSSVLITPLCCVYASTPTARIYIIIQYDWIHHLFNDLLFIHIYIPVIIPWMIQFKIEPSNHRLWPGDATFHHGSTLHAAWRNSGSSTREAIAIVYVPANARLRPGRELNESIRQGEPAQFYLKICIMFVL